MPIQIDHTTGIIASITKISPYDKHAIGGFLTILSPKTKYNTAKIEQKTTPQIFGKFIIRFTKTASPSVNVYPINALYLTKSATLPTIITSANAKHKTLISAGLLTLLGVDHIKNSDKNKNKKEYTIYEQV